MEDFSLTPKHNKEDNGLQMSVSSICQKDGKKIAYVTFSDGISNAEGIIPDCVINKNNGFTPSEVMQLEDYMRQELPILKKMASQVNILDAFIGKKK